ncbi:hypothetical protein MDA_GLEAN10012036 [Myotis davidii]|uniref:Uncharacterized protein n=1 Tax=Myotis davidii TaxID=225400 RepID=L5LUH8_MYODS|nr:hypothetical protein MDA_GLEAN10012036 [Myotis davidii]
MFESVTQCHHDPNNRHCHCGVYGVLERADISPIRKPYNEINFFKDLSTLPDCTTPPLSPVP